MNLRNAPHRMALLLVAVVVALTLALTLPVLAQDAVLEFVGEVQGQTATTITVNGVTVDIQNAEVRGPLAVGALVKVEAALINGQYVAREVETREDDDLRANEIELVGFVQAIDANTLLIGGQLISLSGAQVTPGLDAGAIVRAQVTSTDTGWVARSVRAFTPRANGDDSSGLIDDFDDDDDFELVGTLQGVGDGFIIISGQQFDVSQADVRGLLALGALARVEFEQVGGQWVVTEVRSAALPGLSGNNDDSSGSVLFGNNDNVLRGNNDDSSGRQGLGFGGNLTCGQTPNGWTTYSIVSGDTLSGIAARSGANVAELVAVNCIANPNNVPIGTILAVPRTPAARQLFFGNDDGSFSASGSFRGNVNPNPNPNPGGDDSSRSNTSFSNSNNSDDSSGSRGGRSGGGDNSSNSNSSSSSGS